MGTFEYAEQPAKLVGIADCTELWTHLQGNERPRCGATHGQGIGEWLLVPRNRSLLPRFLQKQIEVGESVSKGASDTDGLRAAADACLSRSPEWTQFYTNNMRDLPSESGPTGEDKALAIALAEAPFRKSTLGKRL